MHGGGFIAFSSKSAQPYTRIWAKSSKIPIFSVDYSLAPKHPFPQALNDCVTVYNFIVKNIHKYFKIDPKSIYFGGDSAGGNLCCGLTAIILQNNMKLPKGLFLAYPSLDMRRVFYGSRR
jgi:hormone-sensitive lipase